MVWDEGQARGLIRDPIGAKEGGGNCILWRWRVLERGDSLYQAVLKGRWDFRIFRHLRSFYSRRVSLPKCEAIIICTKAFRPDAIHRS